MMEVKNNLDLALKNFINLPQHAALRFEKVVNETNLAAVYALRLKIYSQKLCYMLNEIDNSGADTQDKDAFIFAVWQDDHLIASVRLNAFPFETQKYVAATNLQAYLGENWQTHYLEWSRLLVDSACKIRNVANSLAIYAGLYILANTNYTHYFGYTRERVRRLFKQFNFDEKFLEFNIPKRGNHKYLLLKGDFLTDYQKLTF